MERVVVITGASGGIGAALAKELGKKGHRLVLAARRERELKQVTEEIGSNARGVIADVTRRLEVERLRDTALQVFGQVDVWVNNAGRGLGRKVLELTDEDFDEMMAVNVKSALYGMQAILPHFQQRGVGHLINVSSFLSRVPWVTFRSAYSAAKAALNILTANLRVDLKAAYPNIHVSLVLPGVVATDFPKHALWGTPTLPGGRPPQIQTAEDVAGVISSLIEQPRAEVYTNPAQAEIALRYLREMEAFEDGMIAK